MFFLLSLRIPSIVPDPSTSFLWLSTKPVDYSLMLHLTHTHFTFFESKLDNENGKFVLKETTKCTDDLDFYMDVPLDRTRFSYCVCCEDYKPPSEMKCPVVDPWKKVTVPSTSVSTISSTMSKTSLTTAVNPITTASTVDNIESPYWVNCNDTSALDGLEDLFCSYNNTLNSTTVGGFLNKTYDNFEPTTAKDYQIFLLSYIVEKAANVTNINYEDFSTAYKIYDRALLIDQKYFDVANIRGDFSTERILNSIDTFLRNAEYEVDLKHAENLAMRKYTKSSGCQPATGIADYGTEFGDLDAKKQPLASIEIPSDVSCDQSGVQNPVFFVVYRKTQFFTETQNNKSDASLHQMSLASLVQQLGSSSDVNENRESYEEKEPVNDRCKTGLLTQGNRVLTATIASKSKTDCQSCSSGRVMAKIRYLRKDVRDSLHGHQVVTFWTGNEWSSEGRCKTQKFGDYIDATCNHLTDFTLLIDGSMTDPLLCDSTLGIFSILLNVASVLTLLLMGALQLANLSPILQRFAAKFFAQFPHLQFRVEAISFQYTISLFLFFFLFLLFSDQRRCGGPVGCHVFGGLIYFTLLSCIVSTILQSWRVLKLFAWTSRMDNVLGLLTRDVVLLVATLVVPLVVCVIAVIADHQFYNRQDDFCWIRPTSTVFAVVLPLSLMILNGSACMVVIIYRLYPNLWLVAPIRRIMRTNSNRLSRGAKRKSAGRLLTLLNIQFTLGLPWIFQYLTLFSPKATAWHYLFILVNGSQGIVLFGFFVYKRFLVWKNARERTADDRKRTGSEVPTTRRLTVSISNDLKSEQKPNSRSSAVDQTTLHVPDRK
ncbi:Mth-2 [Aphelenchoides besseyi]|nr:Mth-2 [Aphelenchoides besseyi]